MKIQKISLLMILSLLLIYSVTSATYTVMRDENYSVLPNNRTFTFQNGVNVTGGNVFVTNNLSALFLSGDGSGITGVSAVTANSSTYWDGETSQADLNVNSSNFWDTYNIPTDLNNLLTLDWENITNKFVTAVDDIYLYMSGTTATFNETKLNATIDARQTPFNYSSYFDQYLNTTSNVTFSELTLVENSDTIRLTQDGSNVRLNWTDGTFILASNEADTIVQIGKNDAGGSGTGTLIFQDDSGAYHTDITQDDANLFIEPKDSAGNVKFVMSAGDWLVNTTGDADMVHIEGSTNNFGIGVNAPSEKLEVDGNVKATEVIANMNWTYLQNYPVACPANSYLTAVNDSTTCTVVTSIENNVAMNAFNITNVTCITFASGGQICDSP